MEDEQRTVAQSPQEAVDAEFARIIRAAETHFTERASSYRPWLYRIIRTLRPDMTRARWRELAGVIPDVTMSPDVSERTQGQMDHERAQRERREQDQRVHAWLRERGDSTCCPDCNRARVVQLRERGILPPWGDGPPAEPEPERTCACNECTDERCQGDCESCDDHRWCEQCYGDHGTYDCCGYCPECDEHPEQSDTANYHRCAECNRCSECEHYCR